MLLLKVTMLLSKGASPGELHKPASNITTRTAWFMRSSPERFAGILNTVIRNSSRRHLGLSPMLDVADRTQPFNRRFTVPAAERGTAFISCRHRNLEMIFTQRYERTVDRDNTVRFHNLVMQLERAHWRHTLAGCKAIIHQHLDMTLTLMISGHRIGHYSAEGKLLTPLSKKQIKAVEKTSHRLYGY